MKANELMIGDWVYFCHNDEWDTKVVGKVSLLSCGNSEFNEFPHVEKKTVGRIQVEAEDDFQFWQTDEGRNFEPIPLTPEILEKNGFEVSSEHARYYFKEDGEKCEFVLRKMYYINDRKKQKGWSFYAFNVLTIVDYVHELQHALKLCGIEKEIIL